MNKKFFAALIVAMSLLLSFVAQAEIKTYTGVGEDYANQFETQDDAKARALRIAIEDAKKHAGIGLKTYSRSINHELTDDEVSTITSNSYKIVGDVKYERLPLTKVEGSDRLTIIPWRVTVNVEIDDAEVKNWFNHTADAKKILVNQDRAAEEAFNKDIQTADDLKKRTAGTLTEIEEFDLKHEVEAANNDFQVNQKIEEGNRLNYENKPDAALDKYGEALKIKVFYATDTGQYTMPSFDDENIAFLRASDRAKRNVMKKAHVWIKDYSQRIGLDPTDDEIDAIAFFTFEIVDDPEYQIIPLADGSKIINSTVTGRFKSEEIDKWFAEQKKMVQRRSADD